MRQRSTSSLHPRSHARYLSNLSAPPPRQKAALAAALLRAAAPRHIDEKHFQYLIDGSTDPAALAPLLKSAAERRDHNTALNALASRMSACGLAPDGRGYSAIIEARLAEREPARALATCERALSEDQPLEPAVVSALVAELASTDQAHLHKALSLCAALSERRGLFLLAERGPAREALIEAAARSGAHPFEPLTVFTAISAAEEGVLPDGGDLLGEARHALFDELLRRSVERGNTAGARALAREAEGLGLALRWPSVEVLIEAEVRAGNLEAAQRLFASKAASGSEFWRMRVRGLYGGEPYGSHQPESEGVTTFDVRGLSNNVARAGTLHFFREIARHVGRLQWNAPRIPHVVEIRATPTNADAIREACAAMEPSIQLQPASATRPNVLVARSTCVQSWAQKVSHEHLFARRSVGLCLVALGHNVLYFGVLQLAMSGT